MNAFLFLANVTNTLAWNKYEMNRNDTRRGTIAGGDLFSIRRRHYRVRSDVDRCQRPIRTDLRVRRRIWSAVAPPPGFTFLLRGECGQNNTNCRPPHGQRRRRAHHNPAEERVVSPPTTAPIGAGRTPVTTRGPTTHGAVGGSAAGHAINASVSGVRRRSGLTGQTAESTGFVDGAADQQPAAAAEQIKADVHRRPR